MITFRFSECHEIILKGDYEKTASDFMELASEQRLAILLTLLDDTTKISTIAKELGATVPEVYRNFERLVKADLISKNPDGSYGITTIGKVLCSQISTIGFASKNKKYFKNHGFEKLPSKYIQRIGALQSGEHVKGFVKVLEKWKEIYDDADKYIYNILVEVPYNSDMMELLVNKINSGVKLRSIFSESAIIPKDRKQIVDRLGFNDLIKQGLIERKMQEDVRTIVILNEKEAIVMFPTDSGEVDVSEAFFSNDKDFHEWCLDYFNHCWDGAGSFRETKFKE